MSFLREAVRVGYVLKRFPRFSETFILNELLTLQSMGVDLDVFSLLKPPDEQRHARIKQLKVPVIGLSPYGKSAALKLLHGINGDSATLEELLPDVGLPLFSGKSKAEMVALHMKAAAVAVRAHSRNISHLHAHFGSDATTVALLAARMIGGTYSFTAHAKDIYHTYVSEEADRAMRQVKIREAAFVTTVSNYNADYLRKLCPEAANRIQRLYNGIDLSAFSPVSPARQTPGRVIAVGRLVEKKGFSVLIDACSRLRDRGVEFECRIVGDGPLYDALTRQIEERRLQQIVQLVGPLPQEALVDLMETAMLAALPCIVTDSGDRDGLPTVLLEAMAKALPIVTTTVSGGAEIVDHKKTGLLCSPGDPTLFSDAMEQLLQNPKLARRMGELGRVRAQERFDLHTNVGTLKALFARQSQHEVAESVVA